MVLSLPTRLPLRAWFLAFSCLLIVYFWQFTYVHVIADSRVCRLRLDDPLFPLVPFDWGWRIVTYYAFLAIGIASGLVLLLRALFFGDQAPALRYALALAVMGLVRG